ncbi:hypothetical protein TNCV_4932451 [Trichonephila clavipes]|nr:hypothetical protein TNCV_4932451 [Trichonephila clavipes]
MNVGQGQWNRATLCLLTNPFSACSITMIGFEFGDTVIELLPWPACSPYLLPIKNAFSMLAQRLAWDTSPAATPDQIWQYVEDVCIAVPQRHIQSLFD